MNEATPYEAEIGETMYVWPDGCACVPEELEEFLGWKSDDFERREGGYCPHCDHPIVPHYGEPFASSACCTREWYK